MVRGEIRDELLISIKCTEKTCPSTQPLLVKCQSEAFTSRGRFVTGSGGASKPICSGLTRLVALVDSSSRPRMKNSDFKTYREKKTPKVKPDLPEWSLSAGPTTQLRKKKKKTSLQKPGFL